MHIQVGYRLTYDLPQPTPMVLMLTIHPSRAGDILVPEAPVFDPPVAASPYRDIFGNIGTRLVAPPGRFTLSNSAVVRDSGLPDTLVPDAVEHPVETLPDEAVGFLLGSRYCETDLLSNAAWRLFGHLPPGWQRVQAVCDHVHRHIAFDYQAARATRTAAEAFDEGRGVCRDYAHLAITFCRCLNIPARYCTGYLGDMGTPQPWGVPDFAAWFEVYLGGAWHVFDARNNVPRIGRILLARGRDATDVAITTTFGSHYLAGFEVQTDELAAASLGQVEEPLLEPSAVPGRL
ncbi:transglutaminase family protein [Roseomonas sp. OT10]|uniref:transglutaminase-like domain-containing protein n=1 Tax=Roseomonas cutis TaxID=2897332 RepID=UPI001E41FA84|nr:transglutaminase family protein [Roseomonas sp. OT10]UFN50412.1 transglutaminase family protein [Roseomonas sp. OT10]